jgi:uncharacterized membrane protein YebE (DUF533 family)
MAKRKRQKNRQHNGQKKKDQRTNNDLQNITLKTKDRVTRSLLKTMVNSSRKEQIIKENIDKESNTNDNKLSF